MNTPYLTKNAQHIFTKILRTQRACRRVETGPVRPNCEGFSLKVNDYRNFYLINREI